MRSALVVPVKSFARAKARLAPVLDERERAALARTMAARVLAAAGALPVTIACDDEEVAAWARDRGATVAWVPGTDLNGAVAQAVGGLDADRAVVAHADLPHARDLTVAIGSGTEVVLVPDRKRDGTNVLSVPRDAGFTFRYGPGSFERHREEAGRLGLTVVVLEPPDLTWDVDEPDDLPERAPCA